MFNIEKLMFRTQEQTMEHLANRLKDGVKDQSGVLQGDPSDFNQGWKDAFDEGLNRFNLRRATPESSRWSPVSFHAARLLEIELVLEELTIQSERYATTQTDYNAGRVSAWLNWDVFHPYSAWVMRIPENLKIRADLHVTRAKINRTPIEKTITVTRIPL